MITAIANTLLTVLKVKTESLLTSLLKLITCLLLLLEGIQVILIVMAIFIAADQITGVWKAVKSKKFSWKKFNEFYAKLILYLLATILCFLFEKYILELKTHYIAQSIAIIISIQEIASVFDNIEEITGINFLKSFAKKLKNKFL